MREEKGFDTLGIKTDLYLVVLRHFIAIDTEHFALSKHAVYNAVAGFPWRSGSLSPTLP